MQAFTNVHDALKVGWLKVLGASSKEGAGVIC